MKNVFLEIQVLESAGEAAFLKPTMDFAKEHVEELITLEFDNFSESYLVKRCFESMKDTDLALIHIRFKSSQKFSLVLKFLEQLKKLNIKAIQFIADGFHPAINHLMEQRSDRAILQDASGRAKEECIRHFFMIES